MNQNAPPAWFFATFPYWFGGLGAGICLLIATVGGWRRLAVHYRRTSLIAGTTYWFQSAAMRRWITASYGNCLVVTVNDEGIGLSIIFLWRLGHPPLFIPWPDILANQERWLFFFKRVRLSFSLEPSVRMWISTRLARKIQAAVGRDWFEGKAKADIRI